jgi:hypothetical protein
MQTEGSTVGVVAGSEYLEYQAGGPVWDVCKISTLLSWTNDDNGAAKTPMANGRGRYVLLEKGHLSASGRLLLKINLNSKDTHNHIS